MPRAIAEVDGWSRVVVDMELLPSCFKMRRGWSDRGTVWRCE